MPTEGEPAGGRGTEGAGVGRRKHKEGEQVWGDQEPQDLPIAVSPGQDPSSLYRGGDEPQGEGVSPSPQNC